MIIFETIRWKNLLSTGNAFTEIKLNESSNSLVIGVNGAGKSTILDALCFVLFGKAFRKINKPGLVNSVNTKDCVVEIEFKTNNKEYKIIRGIKPNIFEIYCDGLILNQDSASKDYQEHLEKFILKMNYKSFTQIVILGSASFTPFMQLSSNDRRTVIEDLLDTQLVDSNVRDGDQLTPLHFAAGNNSLAVAELLLDRGADKEARDVNQWTPLHCDAENDKLAVAELLLDRGADYEARDE